MAVLRGSSYPPRGDAGVIRISTEAVKQIEQPGTLPAPRVMAATATLPSEPRDIG